MWEIIKYKTEKEHWYSLTRDTKLVAYSDDLEFLKKQRKHYKDGDKEHHQKHKYIIKKER